MNIYLYTYVYIYNHICILYIIMVLVTRTLEIVETYSTPRSSRDDSVLLGVAVKPMSWDPLKLGISTLFTIEYLHVQVYHRPYILNIQAII